MMKNELSWFDAIILGLLTTTVFFGIGIMSNCEEQMKKTLEQSLQLQQEQIEVLKNLEVKIK